MKTMKKFLLLFISISISHFVFSQTDTTLAKMYGNDSLYQVLNSTPTRVSADSTGAYYITCLFTHSKTRHSKVKPYYWNAVLKKEHIDHIPATVKPVKLFILSDTAIYEFTYLQKRLCWNKTMDVYQKPVAVVVEFMDTTTGKKYFVRAKGPFKTKH
jgi:hypothetical protein